MTGPVAGPLALRARPTRGGGAPAGEEGGGGSPPTNGCVTAARGDHLPAALPFPVAQWSAQGKKGHVVVVVVVVRIFSHLTVGHIHRAAHRHPGCLGLEQSKTRSEITGLSQSARVRASLGLSAHFPIRISPGGQRTARRAWFLRSAPCPRAPRSFPLRFVGWKGPPKD